jgi:hypothetical protein
MKSNNGLNSKPQNTPAPKSGAINNNKPRPEIRDNLDSREGKEQQTKGNDVTHNKKETKNKKNQ